MNIPNDIPLFLRDSTEFIECNYEQADKFYRTYGKDTTPRALKFIHKARKILSTAKTVLDELQIPFWISSGTLLGKKEYPKIKMSMLFMYKVELILTFFL